MTSNSHSPIEDFKRHGECGECYFHPCNVYLGINSDAPKKHCGLQIIFISSFSIYTHSLYHNPQTPCLSYLFAWFCFFRSLSLSISQSQSICFDLIQTHRSQVEVTSRCYNKSTSNFLCTCRANQNADWSHGASGFPQENHVDLTESPSGGSAHRHRQSLSFRKQLLGWGLSMYSFIPLNRSGKNM